MRTLATVILAIGIVVCLVVGNNPQTSGATSTALGGVAMGLLILIVFANVFLRGPSRTNTPT